MLMKNKLNNTTQHEYMSGIARSKKRAKDNNEVFTPTELVREIIAKYPDEYFADPTKNFLDPSCGDGQILLEVVLKKVEHGCTFEQALSTTYGVEKELDNAELCRTRLLCGHEEFRHIVEKNIVCADSLEYHYRFDGSPPYDEPNTFNNFFE